MKTTDDRNLWLLLFSWFFGCLLLRRRSELFCCLGVGSLSSQFHVGGVLLLLLDLLGLTIHDVGVPRLITVLLLQNIVLGRWGVSSALLVVVGHVSRDHLRVQSAANGLLAVPVHVVRVRVGKGLTRLLLVEKRRVLGCLGTRECSCNQNL